MGKTSQGKAIRIDKLFSVLGILTRTQCKAACAKGEIEVNGQPCKSSDLKIDRETDTVRYKGNQLDTREFVYYMLNKPAGVITANDDPRQKTVFDLIEDKRTDLFAVGRLDKDTTGILLITNDGDLNHRMLSPKKHVAKRYRVTIDGCLTDNDVLLLCNGIDIGDEKPTLPAQVQIIDNKTSIPSAQPVDNETSTSPDQLIDNKTAQTVYLTITEGRYHQVKRMFEALGKPVLKLHRDKFGPIELDPALDPGSYRELSPEELALIN